MGIRETGRGFSLIEKALRKDSVYQALFDDGSDGMVIAETSGRVLDANPLACEILAREKEDLLAGGVESLFVAGDRRPGRALAELRREGRFRGELPLFRSDDRRIETFVTMVCYGASGEGRVSVMLRDPRPGDSQASEKTEKWFSSLMRHISDTV